MRKCYVVKHDDEGFCHAIVATSKGKAKVMFCSEYDVDFLDVSVKTSKIDVSTFQEGLIEDAFWCLKKGLYECVRESECPTCGTTDDIRFENGKYVCSYCEDDEEVRQ